MIKRKTNPNNGLQKQLFLLPAGKDVLKQVNSAFEEVNELVSNVNTDTLLELEAISANLEKQVQNIKNKTI